MIGEIIIEVTEISKIDFEDCSVEIENDSYFGVNEELAGYDVICLKNGDFESSVMSDNLYVKKFLIRKLQESVLLEIPL